MSRPPRLVFLPPQHLGHELHVGRCIIVDMFRKGFLERKFGDSVMTSRPDRKFLYEAIFDSYNVFDLTEITADIGHYYETGRIKSELFSSSKKFSKYHIISLAAFACPPPLFNDNLLERLSRTGYQIPAYGYNVSQFITEAEKRSNLSEIGYKIPKKYFDEDFISVCSKFRYVSSAIINHIIPSEINEFLVIHLRAEEFLDVKTFENLESQLRSLPKFLPKVIFSAHHKNELEEKLIKFSNVYFVNNLQIYASLLNDSRCKLLISEDSGGGQIAQYLLSPDSEIWFYFDFYDDLFRLSEESISWQVAAHSESFMHCWVHKNISGCKIKYFKSHDNLIERMLKIRYTMSLPN